MDPVAVIQRIDGFEGFVTVVGRLGRFETFPGAHGLTVRCLFPDRNASETSEMVLVAHIQIAAQVSGSSTQIAIREINCRFAKVF